MLRLPDGRLLVAAKARSVTRLAAFSRSFGLSANILLSAPRVFTRYVVDVAGAALADYVQSGPAAIDPDLSAGSGAPARYGAQVLVLCSVIALIAAAYEPLLLDLAFAALFIAITALRLVALTALVEEPKSERIPDDQLPIYTLLIPLYRESRCLGGLLRALRALDYPEAKLDIKLLVEHGDAETRAALAVLDAPSNFETIVVPQGSPRTKPRALNLGLAAARGAIIGVFDAEDRPEPGQLRDAVQAFLRGGPQLACVQARLVIDNRADSWITRVFALEYAGLFDALLPGLSRCGLMFPLGGTSNHFRTAVLDRVGGWDAWNLTEDADLGVRLARFGYRCATISSSTLEEAPNTHRAWLRQRTRWLMGYVVTWIVHMRRPVRLHRELGWRNALVFHAFIGGVPISALMLPIFVGGLIVDGLSSGWLVFDDWVGWLELALTGTNLVLGFGTAMAIAAIGADRRNLTGQARWIALVPLYWLMSSVAAWRAVWRLIRAPHVWEKTEHGLARTSASAAGPGFRRSAPGPSRPRRARGRG
ncbi:glycosyltransferase [Flaviflagellibacter deserti]|uniref:Glycosyltransferase n=1 Tax=Flaviflagellibacter deserti TaxID=2267266 RepID=A0ABV9YYZ5_9HYPH